MGELFIGKRTVEITQERYDELLHQEALLQFLFDASKEVVPDKFVELWGAYMLVNDKERKDNGTEHE